MSVTVVQFNGFGGEPKGFDGGVDRFRRAAGGRQDADPDAFGFEIVGAAGEDFLAKRFGLGVILPFESHAGSGNAIG